MSTNKMGFLSRAFNDLSMHFMKEDAPLDSSADGREIISLMEQMAPKFCRDLSVYAETLTASDYVPRIFLFTKTEGSPKGIEWVCRRVELAGPEYMSGNPEQLRTVMDNIASQEDRHAIALWVSYMSGDDNDKFYVFMRHTSGREAQAVIVKGQWLSGPCNKRLTDATLASLLKVDEAKLEKLQGVMKDQLDSVGKHLRSTLESSLRGRKASDISNSEWEHICLSFVISESNLLALQESSRRFATRAVEESQQQLEAMCRAINEASGHFERKTVQMEKDHQRALVKFKADIAAEKEVGKLKDRRIASVSSEVGVLRRKLIDKSSAGHDTLPTIGICLDEMFP